MMLAIFIISCATPCFAPITSTQQFIQDAADLLEGLVREDPTSFLTERRVAFNLCIL
jgi:hypothetical protein